LRLEKYKLILPHFHMFPLVASGLPHFFRTTSLVRPAIATRDETDRSKEEEVPHLFVSRMRDSISLSLSLSRFFSQKCRRAESLKKKGEFGKTRKSSRAIDIFFFFFFFFGEF